MREFIKPDWNNCNVNISSTLAEFLGVPNKNSTLPILKEELQKNYKNIVFLCLDGLGIYPINKNLDTNSFLSKNIKQVLTSTFPSTTTNATTSLITNKLPYEHGWFGWSLYFDEINKNIDIYLHSDSQTGEKVDYVYPIIDNADCYFDKAHSDYSVTAIMPSYVQTNKSVKIAIANEDDLCNEIKKVCEKDGKQFIYAYFPEPDATMHNFGVNSLEAKKKISVLNQKIEKLCESLHDTLVIITADHGHIDIEGYVEFYKDTELNSLLKGCPYLDGRTPAFRVKEGKEKEFEEKFDKKYGDDFKLFKSSELIKENYFGGTEGFTKMLGDYIAVGTFTHKQFLPHENYPRFKGHHTSLTEEMEVPLIMYSKK
ncbi:MAG: hypothetical protein E7354_00435 [Clostridiales bacterium]|nr:hypothetical protein [Clostridiales bacterium]